jgi:ATP adenylyltransferase
MPDNRLRLRPGTLWQAIVRRTELAIGSGALCPIETEQRFIEESGVRFVVRMVSSLARKDADKAREAEKARESGEPVNPFLPYEKVLFVTEISDTHVCLLNKFSVIDHHLLIVTREFEDQEVLLTLADFEALSACMAEFDALAFYNGGTIAGASQPHKHLQVVPLPLASDGPRVPIEPLLETERPDRTTGTVAGLPFLHAFAWLDPTLVRRPLAAARAALERYRAMLDAVGLKPVDIGGELRQSAPYNLLLTREWMLLVPRSKEFFDRISVNALGFAGSLFVRDARQMKAVEDHGPMTVLRRVAVSDP